MKSILTALVLVCLTLVGCGPERPKMVTLTGKVIHQGKAVTAGSVHFFPDAANAYQKDNPSSLLQLDGSFTAKTYPFGDGIPPGVYKATLAPQLASRLNAPDYADPAKTPWKVTVPDTGLTDQVLEVKASQSEAPSP